MPAGAVVVDASAMAALLFGEPDGPEVAWRMEGRTLLAPTLLRYEMARVCVKKIGEAPEQTAGLLSALRLMPRMGIREVQAPAEGLVEIARETGLTAYDAAYLWLVREMGAHLVSLDRRLQEAAGGGEAHRASGSVAVL
jgi:predicted nucleic acid-binding protein